MSQTRRELLMQALLGGGGLGLRALASGLPAALLRPAAAQARGLDAAGGLDPAAQFLILSTSSAGDPVNANTPGTYEHPAIEHSADPRMAPTALRLGPRRVTAAAPWAGLPQAVLDRTVFFHHSTPAQSHPHNPRVLELGGAPGDSAPALFARYLGPRLDAAQDRPVLVGAKEQVNCGGQPLPRLCCTELRAALTQGPTPLYRLAALRDQSLDAVHRALRHSGDREQRTALEQHARSRREAQALGDRLLADLHAIKDNGPAGQVAAAAALVRLGAAPVVCINIPFGGDNHFDYEFRVECEETVSGVAHIAALLDKLADYGLRDKASFALLNVFGRTLRRHGRAGRDHWADHHTAVVIGRPFAPAVIGGVAPRGDDFAATPICARTGAPVAADTPQAIALSATLPSLGKTLGHGLGLPQELLDAAIPCGQVVRAALSERSV